MTELIHDFIARQARDSGDSTALLHKEKPVSYRELWERIEKVAHGLLACGLDSGDRVGIYLPKQVETVTSIFGTAYAGGTIVPVNPVLKPQQVRHILSHCEARVLITSRQRYDLLQGILADCHELTTVILVDDNSDPSAHLLGWSDLLASPPAVPWRRIDQDMAAILYTSGSTGQPKGVVLSHRNMVAGALSVSGYLGNRPDDRILAVLPLSFDAGLSQLTTGFSAGAAVVLLDYLLPRDVLRAVQRYGITGITAVPSLWNQLAALDWPLEASRSLRYIATTGGVMPVSTTQALSQKLPDTALFLMYGLTEAFRSTYLPPDQVAQRPTSIGKAVPNAEILIVSSSGALCGPGEPGELVHRGALVSLGYWNDPEKTTERFRPMPNQNTGLPLSEIAVWSGDQVVSDDEGYLYFVSRQDEMIKTSGYRVSPTEVESVAYASGLIAGAVALGVAHPMLGQAIVLVVSPAAQEYDRESVSRDLLRHCQRELPGFMVPGRIVVQETLPHTPNGKVDRTHLTNQYSQLFEAQ